MTIKSLAAAIALGAASLSALPVAAFPYDFLPPVRAPPLEPIPCTDTCMGKGLPPLTGFRSDSPLADCLTTGGKISTEPSVTHEGSFWCWGRGAIDGDNLGAPTRRIAWPPRWSEAELKAGVDCLRSGQSLGIRDGKPVCVRTPASVTAAQAARFAVGRSGSQR